MHAAQADNYSLNYFGNEAEKKYYTEYLVCGQADPKPSLQDTLGYKNFQMSKNVCCREVGSDLSTHTSYVPTSVNPNSASNLNASLTDDTYDRLSFGLKTTYAPGMTPNDPYRYSRLATVENLGNPNRPGLSAFQDKSGSSLTSGLNVMTPYQWKTLSEANSESCCGGGWIRKFSDGSNDWTKRDRLYIDVKNFTCINSRTSLLTNPADFEGAYPSAGDAINLVNQDLGSYCKDSSGTKGSCALFTISDSINDDPPTSDFFRGPSAGAGVSHYKTYGIDFTTYIDYYFYPRSADSDSAIIIDNAKIGTNGGRANITIKIPSFITTQSFDDLISSYPTGGGSLGQTAGVRIFNIAAGQETAIGEFAECVKKDLTFFSSVAYPTSTGSCSTGDGAHCCYAFDASNRILKVVPATNSSYFQPSTNATKKLAVKLVNASPAGFGSSSITRNKPGSNTHYLKRLGKLELTGIPQISYEALTCSDYAERLVPGIFKKILKFDFDQPDFSFIQTLTDPDTGVSATSRFTNRHGLEHEPIFSENDFKCCTPLGKTNKDQTKCCSGYGVAAGNTFTCALPGGTDLMVYFNRFVSNEGIGSDKPGGGLGENDFNFITGEPKLSTTVNQKISALGKAYCESKKVRQGGAFGEFPLEPVGNETNLSEKIYGIVDSARDEGKVSSAGATIPVGYTAFMAGFRWNHHLYCQD